MAKLRAIGDPRENPKHRERGPARHTFTLPDLAEAAGRSLGTVYNTHPPTDDLVAVAQYIQEHRMERSRKVRAEDNVGAILRLALGFKLFEDAELAARWEARWPRVALYFCAEDARLLDATALGCDLLLAPGFCLAHGGGKQGLVFVGRYLGLRLDGPSMPLHRLLTGDPPGMDVHHVDGNWWNNRLANLAVLTPKAHARKHLIGGA